MQIYYSIKSNVTSWGNSLISSSIVLYDVKWFWQYCLLCPLTFLCSHVYKIDCLNVTIYQKSSHLMHLVSRSCPYIDCAMPQWVCWPLDPAWSMMISPVSKSDIYFIAQLHSSPQSFFRKLILFLSSVCQCCGWQKCISHLLQIA